jgi:DNA polymerase
LRRDGARASTRKLDRLLKSVDNDSRLRGSLRFHGSATGRWSGRGYQPQNLKKPETNDIDAAVSAVLSGDTTLVRTLGAPLTIAGDVSRSIIFAAPSRTLQRIPVKLTHSQHVESSCGILHEKVSE